MTETYQCITYETTGRAVVITLARPKARNAVNAQMTLELAQAMARFESDPEALVGILTGEGETFCAGMDLKAFLAGEGEAIVNGPKLAQPEPESRFSFLSSGVDRLGELLTKSSKQEPRYAGFAGFIHFPRTKPVIAAVNGPALAGGFEIVLACDLVIAAEGAAFGLPEPKVGLFAAAGGAFRLPRIIPANKAMEMLLTGDPITAQEALSLGLINAIHPAPDLRNEALKLAARITKNAPFALMETYNLARASRQRNEAAFWEETRRGWQRILTTEDAKEGPAAFAEKRAAEWKG
ncbi:MAG: enoyl-CoA hydratase/isomerase family protein [Proteobacteria bacterium]|nr:enoyl-CoA hydratase/isomerase family protein [Pseudomonadota bacterium]MBU1612529.1 enoyl-CoA hydratase/isomerase family protein [Pseudomonadota bacterium]